MKQKIYILTTITHYEQTDERAIWSEAYPTRKAAEKAMREKIREDMDDYCEGASIIEGESDYRKIIRNAIEAGGEEHDALIDWTADRLYIYDIFPATIEIKEGRAMKRMFEIQVSASLTKWYNIEAEDEAEAKAIAEKRMNAETVVEHTACGGSWDLVEKVVEHVLNKEG